MNQIEKNLYLINERINNSCKIYERKKSEINLVAVSKKVEELRIIQAINAGCTIFGENYIKEAKEKWPKIKEQYPQIKLHFIGHLQSNKAKEAAHLFDCIETLDSENLVKNLSKECIKQNKQIECFIQVNIGEEEQKGGIDPSQIKEFIEFCHLQNNINITGLMCKNNIAKISMGMSEDFEQAIALNSTHIRLGTAIFGKR